MRPPIVIKNTTKAGEVMEGWFVRVGQKSRNFTAVEWAKDGLTWIQDQMRKAR